MHQPRLCHRTRPRYEAYLDSDIDTGAVLVEGRVLSLSDGGLFAATDLPLSPGTRVTLSFQLPDFSGVRIQGIVIYRAFHNDSLGLGVRFLGRRETDDASRIGMEAIRRTFGQVGPD